MQGKNKSTRFFRPKFNAHKMKCDSIEEKDGEEENRIEKKMKFGRICFSVRLEMGMFATRGRCVIRFSLTLIELPNKRCAHKNPQNGCRENETHLTQTRL